MKGFLSDSLDLFNDSYILMNSIRKKDESTHEKKSSKSNIENSSISSDEENKTIDNNLTLLSIPSEVDEELKKYTIPKTKTINCININPFDSYIEDKNKFDKKEMNKKLDNIKITNIIFSKLNINTQEKKFKITRLDKDPSNHSKYIIDNKYSLSIKKIDKNKKQQKNTRKMVGVNLKKFVKLDMNNTTNNLDDKYNPKKTEKIKEKIIRIN